MPDAADSQRIRHALGALAGEAGAEVEARSPWDSFGGQHHHRSVEQSAPPRGIQVMNTSPFDRATSPRMTEEEVDGLAEAVLRIGRELS
jgi:hypothetical protein